MPPRSFDIRERNCNPDVARRLLVRLDGVPVSKVRAYDVERGEVVRIRSDHAGRPLINQARDACEEETLYGVVTVEWRD